MITIIYKYIKIITGKPSVAKDPFWVLLGMGRNSNSYKLWDLEPMKITD